ncbi:MAG TPA: hypothetical protein EYG15_01325 [Deltaproteobacteria bacterium]|jgi:hypothetical protein|nr:hypothetical protein [SAR324 cluster bacterium]HIF70253.1 hypothetical protein [Candidatus Lambdaproteobacteria bacterium]HIL14737.1 hypothetical protein [Deltaproteobacteria bacterium]|tara:strand:- start:2212 stop:3588 length:1377 start_codon:yes stop_codon:yes gene_type:complete
MSKTLLRILVHILFVVLLVGCASAPKPTPKPKAENFLTLADVNGRISFRESNSTPDIRVIRAKAKAFIKQNDLRSAKILATNQATSYAVDDMVRELLTEENYNNNFEKIEEYLSKNLDSYVVDKEIVAEKRIFANKYYGIDTAFKISRQKVLVALQKDLKLINTSSSTLVVVITSKKDIDLSGSGFQFGDLEEALLNQIQTDLNQRGLRAMDFRNAVTHLQTDEKTKEQFGKISKEQFLAVVSGSPADRALLNKQIQNAEGFYTTGLSLLQQLAKVVVEVNIFSISGNTKGDLALSLNVTAKNISTGRGGAFANTVANVARRGGPNVIPSAMITGLVQDTYQDLKREFIPQVIKEMSTITVGGDKLMPYEIVLKGFDSRNVRRFRSALDQRQNDQFRYIDYDNTLAGTEPSIVTIRVRYAGKPDRLADLLMGILDGQQIDFKEPRVAPELKDIVIEHP